MTKINRLLIVGGASGVGKSTVLKALATHPQLNTGDYFKAAMKIADRDSIKSSNWLDYQAAVADSLIRDVSELSDQNPLTIIDTHFAAKAYNKSYRIGLEKDFLYKLGVHAFREAEERARTLHVIVALISCDPYALLDRRRLDTKRKRELFPADCVNALRENNRCSVFYLHEMARARTDVSGNRLHSLQFTRIENADLRKARRQLLGLVGDENGSV